MAGVIALPAPQGRFAPGIAVALADDDDDGGDDDGGSSRGGRGGEWQPKARGDLRSLFRWPSREVRRAPLRRAVVAVPERAPNEIVATGLDDDAIAGLAQDGFVVDDRVEIALIGGEMVRLIVPQGMTLDAARAAVSARSASATVDFNHFYQPQAGDKAACVWESCALVRHMVGWPTGEAGSGLACLKPQRIGLIDTAINAKHTVLANARLEVLDLGDDDGAPSGEQHGTAVAALLVGAPGSRVPGLLPGAELVAVDAFQRFRKSTDIANVYDLVRALDLLIGRDIKVVNLSLTGPENQILERAVEAAADRGTILVAAAGNDGPNAKPVYPAAYEDVIAVTAVDKARNPYRRAVRGDHIDIAAPGVGVWTAASISGARQKSGTSFAAPFVTAAVSILLAEKPGLSPQEVEAELMKSAEDMGKPGKDAIYGWGLLNARTLCGSG
ncbi:S8 family serine peptidase [Shinella sp.]|uniref:S8 family serine peptidase n=1 Tax=Shinella sp. TaxID=1870904 RepID=UPI0029AE3E59|nr:S8 family serine peptidase [Shinella sp.]MDX3974562.1 S8 family serine peptidase [Shinella sp.]